MLVVPVPSVLPEYRSRAARPLPGSPVPPLLRVYVAQPERYPHPESTSFFNCHHPIVAALAPPQCAMRHMRLCLAVPMQGAVDVAVGAAALGCAILCYGMGQKELAGAFLLQHSVNLMQLYMVVILTLGAGCALGTFVFLTT